MERKGKDKANDKGGEEDEAEGVSQDGQRSARYEALHLLQVVSQQLSALVRYPLPLLDGCTFSHPRAETDAASTWRLHARLQLFRAPIPQSRGTCANGERSLRFLERVGGNG